PNFKPDAKHLKERSFDFKAKEPGVYKFELRVNDSKQHWSEPAQLTVTVTPGKPPSIDNTGTAEIVELAPKVPVAERKKPELKAVAAPGRTAKAGETIILDGSKSLADEALKPEFFWRQEGAPLARQLAPDKSRPFSPARLTDPLNYPVWTCKPEQPGEYKFVLEVTVRTPAEGGEVVTKAESEPVVYKVEGAGQEGTPTPPPPPTTATPPTPPTPPVAAAEPPVARISAERTLVAAGEMVKLDGSKSSGKPGEKLEYFWGPVPGKRYPKNWRGTEGPQVEFKAEEEGEYAVALMVKDSTGKGSELAQVLIKTEPAGRPPVLKLAKSYECVVGEQVRIETEATDPDGSRLEYKWTCVDPPDLAIPENLTRNATLVFVPRKPAAYVFKVTVTNAKGLSVSGQAMVGVKDALARPPSAIVDGPKKPASTGTKVVLSGARSADPAKKRLKYLWKQEDGPGGAKVPGNVPGPEDKEWEFVPTEPGRYVFSLVVSNGVNKSDPDKFELTVAKANNPPVANIVGPAGGRLQIGEKVTLDGSTSSDPDNDKLTYKWRKAEAQPKGGAKLGEVELANTDQEKATAQGVTAGPVRIELVVNDGTVDSEPAYVDLNVLRLNHPPVAKITGPEAAKVGGAVELSAAESSDPDGDPITYVWSQPADGGPEIGVRGGDLRKKILKFKPQRPGSYVISLVVVDSEGLKSEPVTHKVEVKGPHKAPIAVATRVGNEAVAVGSEVKLTAHGSRGAEGATLKYKWKQVAGETLAPFANDALVDSEVVNAVPKTPGKYAFELVVNDGEMDSPPAALSFTAKAANRPPVAVAADVLPCAPGERVVLDGSASHDPDGDKLEYRWSQVSGPDAKFSHGTNKARTEVELPTDGEYVFELKVFDGKDWSEPVRVPVKTRAPRVPPVAAVAQAELRTEENVETVLDASPSNDPNNGPQPLAYHWKQMSGPKVDLVKEDPKARFTPKKAGILVFQLKVFDGKAESAPAEIKVEVLKAGTLPRAVASAEPNPSKVAQKGNKDDLNYVVFGAEKSRAGAGGGALTYHWKQVSGEDLHVQRMNPAELAKVRWGLRIFRPGTYRFELVVSDGQNQSVPAYVDIEVIDGTKAPEPGAGAKSGDSAPKTESPPPPAPKAETPAPPAPKTETPAPPAPKETPEVKKMSAAPAPEPPAKGGEQPPGSAASPQPENAVTPAKKSEPESEEKLIEALSNADQQVRSTAAVALSKRGRNAVPALIEVLETGSAPAKKDAHWTLREITHESFPADAEKWRKWWNEQGKQPAAPPEK
ncbi:MAG: PKD domain-containing protein, partial [Planctomycetota bacterium]